MAGGELSDLSGTPTHGLHHGPGNGDDPVDPGARPVGKTHFQEILGWNLPIRQFFYRSHEKYFEKSENFVCICEKMGYNRME